MPLGATADEAVLGREHERAELQAALDAARAGSGQAVVLTGEAGIGKTSVVESFAESAASGVAVHWGRCWEAGGAAAYWPWAQVLRSIAADLEDALLPTVVAATGPDLALLVPELTARLPGLVPAAPTESPDARLRLFDGVVAFLRSAAQDRGMVVALEDLHWADQASLHLLRHVQRGLTGARLLVVATWRDAGPAGSQVRRLLDAVVAGAVHLPLSGLDAATVATVLERATGESVTAETARTVWARTDGNPFYVGELARVLGTGDRMDLAAAGAGGLVERRLGSLSISVLDVLISAALVGREVPAALLAGVTGRPTAELLDVLGEAERAGVVKALSLGRWTFTHSLLVEALAARLDREGRRRAHLRIGTVLEAEHATDPDVRHAGLAHHFSEAGDAPRTLRYSASAGEQAMAGLAFEEATLHFGRALDALGRCPPVDQGWRCDLLLSYARAQFLAHDFPAARRAHAQAVRAARAVGDPERLARAALGFTGYLGGGDEGIRLLEEAVGALPPADSTTRSQLLVTLAAARGIQAASDERPQVRALAEEGVEMARRVGDPATLCRVLVMWHRLLLEIDLSSLPVRLAAAEEATWLATEATDREMRFWAGAWRFGDLMEAGDLLAADVQLDAITEEAQALRLPYLRWVVAHQRASLALHEGRLPDAERLVEEALAAGELTGSSDVEIVFAVQWAAVLRHRGELEQLADLARRQARLAEDDPRPEDSVALASFWRATGALGLAMLGRRDEARCLLAVGDLEPPSVGRGNKWLQLLVSRAEVAWLLDDAEAAGALHAQLAPLPELHVVGDVAIRTLGSTSRYVALLAAVLGRADEADAAFAVAHRHHRRLGTPLWLAHGQADHARFLLARGAPGDGHRAAELLARAGETYRGLGMAFYERRVATAGVAPVVSGCSGGRAAFRPEGDGWLVAYEGRVARLVDTKGMGFLARLLARPNEELEAVELAGTGASGRLDADRVRLSVTRALRTAMERVGDAHPALGEHLRRTVRTGHRCSYVPDPRAPVAWET